jgi:molecular chaperone DnaK
MATAVGIDLGTTNSVIAATEAGKPTVIPNAEGSRTTPSVVAFTPDGERLVGRLARRQAILNPKGTIYSAKRFIGRRFGEVHTELNAVSFDVVAGPDGAARFEIGGKQYAPEEISALVLRKLAEDASKLLGEKVTEAVITVRAAAELQQVYHGLGAAASAASDRLDQQPGAPQPGGPQGDDSDDVIDAELTTHE